MRKLLVPVLSVCIVTGWFSSSALGADDQAKPPAIYVSMHPHFLTNLADGKSFVQIKAQAMVSNEATQTALRLHMPAVRHELLMLLGEMKATDLKGVEQMHQQETENEAGSNTSCRFNSVGEVKEVGPMPYGDP